MIFNLPKHSVPILAVVAKSLETIALDIGCAASVALALVMALVLTVTDWLTEER